MEESMPAKESTKKCKKEVKYPSEGKKKEGKKCLMLWEVVYFHSKLQIHTWWSWKNIRPEPSTTSPIMENIPDMCQYRTSFRAKKPLIYVGTAVKIDVLKSTTQ